MSWHPQIAAVSRPALNKLRLITHLRPYLDKGSLRTLVQALVITWIDYYNALYVGLPLNLTQRLQQVKKVAAGLVAGGSKFEPYHSSSGSPTLAALGVSDQIHGFDLQVKRSMMWDHVVCWSV